MVDGAPAIPGPLQKAYDESYLACSTAVYYESEVSSKFAIQGWPRKSQHSR